MWLLVGLALQTLASMPAVEQGWPLARQAPLVAVSIGNPALFWLFARALFDDRFRLRTAHLATWLGCAAIGACFCLAFDRFGAQAAPTLALKFVLRWIPAVFAAMVVVAAASQWRADLVEPRRRLRAFIVVAGAADGLVMVGVRLNSAHGVPSAEAALFDVTALLVMTLAVGLATLRIGDDGALLPVPVPAQAWAAPTPDPPPPTAIAAPDALEIQLAAKLNRLMTTERVYRVDDLTLGVLALKLGVPEYRLRRFIHQRLGQRNFNAYLNGMRLAEVQAALTDPARRGAGVLEIALEAGFASAGPFNRAFKAETGVTPTEYRRSALADS